MTPRRTARHHRHFSARPGGPAAAGFALLLLGQTARAAGPSQAEADRPPSVVIVFADDMGYADIGPFGAAGGSTPHLDRMAAEGVRFTDFYAAQAVCSASRAALMTGRYPNRVGILGALGPASPAGIAEDELLLPELLRTRGYATAHYGKWHLGHRPESLPDRHGFDDYFGLPYSNDMWPKHPTDPNYPDLPLIDGDQIIEHNPDQRTLTARYTERAVRFIESQRERPFFLYLAHSMPHVPLAVSEARAGATGAGLYADVIAEIDWSVGEILGALRRCRIDDRTLVIFTSDNGPWLSYGDHAGSAGPLREGKGTTFEGGVRVPFLARWPGRIAAGSVRHEPAMTIDLWPTLARLSGAAVPSDRVIDGRDIGDLLLSTPGTEAPDRALLFFWGRELQAVRRGRWKLHLPHAYRSLEGEPGQGGQPGPYEERRIGLALFDLEADPGETRDVAASHPDVVEGLQKVADAARRDLPAPAPGRAQGRARTPAGTAP